MVNSKENLKKNIYLVKKVSLVDSFMKIPIGRTALFTAIEAGSLSSARSAASRLSQRLGQSFTVDSNDNGVTYTVTRK